MKFELHPSQAQISKALYVIRLRHKPLAVSRSIKGRWMKGCGTVGDRVRNNAEHMRRGLFGRPSDPKRWQPDCGRESPREEWMSWRESMTRYAYPGWMRFHHGKAPPLVGRALLYAPFSARRSPWGKD